jgi:hypothetical protein
MGGPNILRNADIQFKEIYLIRDPDLIMICNIAYEVRREHPEWFYDQPLRTQISNKLIENIANLQKDYYLTHCPWTWT